MDLRRKIIILFMIIVCILGCLFPKIAFAGQEIIKVSDIRIVTTDSEKRKLLGGKTVEEARTENLLGIAGEFSVFVEDTLSRQWYKTDIGGKAAIGKDFSFSYESQVGCERYNYQKTTHDGSADIVLGIGDDFVWRHSTMTAFSATKQGNQYDMQKLIAIPENIPNSYLYAATYWSGLANDRISGTINDVFVRANLIDFEEEFKYLRKVSANLASMENTGTIIESEETNIVTNDLNGNKNYAIQGTVFKGSNPFYNIFNLTAESWNSYENIIFDVPYDSYVIINIEGNNIVFSDVKSTEIWANDVRVKNIFYPISRSEILKDGLNAEEPAYLIDRNNPVGDTARDEDGYVKTYVQLLSADEKNWDKGEYILYNLPNATSFKFDGNWVGSILAPNAEGTDTMRKQTVIKPGTTYTETVCGGHLAGNLICKSHDGAQEFGNTLFSMPNSYLDLIEIEISSVNSISDKLVSGATMQIRDLNGNVIYKWETTEKNKIVKLPKGEKFILEEVNVPTGYTTGNPIAFSINKIGNMVIHSGISYKEVESVGITYSNLSTSISNYTNKNRINKIEFVPDTSTSTVRADWNLDCVVPGSTKYRSQLSSWSGIYLEHLKWTHTDDGDTVTAYLPLYEITGGIWSIYFYRGSTQVSDVKLKSLTTYTDTEKTKTTSSNISHAKALGTALKFYNTPTTGIKININNIEKDSNVKIAGTGFGLYSAEKNDLFEKDELITGGITNQNGNLVLEEYCIPLGKYYIKEISTKDSYIPSTQIWEYTLNQGTTLQNDLEVMSEIALTKVNISKKIKDINTPVSNVAFGVFAKENIKDENGNLIYIKDNLVYDEKTGEDGTLEMVFSKNNKYLPLGKYYIKEIGGPSGVVYDENTYEIEIQQMNKNYTFNVENDCTKVEISNIDILTGNPIVGANMQLQNEKGDTVATWTTTENPYRINALEVGKYKLIEVQPATGYIQAEPVEFIVKLTEEIQKVEMKSDYTKVEILTADNEAGKLLIGLNIRVENHIGTLIGDWTVGNSGYRIDRLPVGKYNLVLQNAEQYAVLDKTEFEVTATPEIKKVSVEAKAQVENETKTEDKVNSIDKENISINENIDKSESLSTKENVDKEDKKEELNQSKKSEILNSVVTGDSILITIVVMLLSAITLAIIVKYRKILRIKKK